MPGTDAVTATGLLAAASEILTKNGYVQVPEEQIEAPRPSNTRVFEDAYSIVAVIVYETWGELASGWRDEQGWLVETLSQYVKRGEAKSWDGYLVLATPGVPGIDEESEVASIKYDTDWVRKLVATGNDLQAIDDIKAVLLPLLPLDMGSPPTPGRTVLDRLPEILADKGIPSEAADVLRTAFESGESLVDALHGYLESG